MIDRAELQRLLIAAADGDRAAIDPLFHALWPLLVAYSTRLVGDGSLAEDCAQETVVRLFGQLDRFDRERDALTWAFAIATWQARTARRRTQRRGEQLAAAVDAGSVDPTALPFGGAADRAQVPAIDGAALAEEHELVRAALATLDTLAPHDREIIFAVIGDDDELRRSLAPATFRKRLERALARLRTSWRSRHGTL